MLSFLLVKAKQKLPFPGVDPLIRKKPRRCQIFILKGLPVVDTDWAELAVERESVLANFLTRLDYSLVCSDLLINKLRLLRIGRNVKRKKPKQVHILYIGMIQGL